MAAERPTRAALYMRVSTKDQATEGTSLGTQSERLRAHAERLGWKVIGEFADDGVNGDLPVADRPRASRMVELCARGAVDVVAVTDLDRFGRDLVETLVAERELERAGVGLVSIGEGIDTRRESDRMNLHYRAVGAEHEKRRMLERTKRGLHARAREGYWPGGPPPFGFRLAEPVGSSRQRLAIDEAEAETLRHATALIVDHGHTTWTAAKTLNALGMLPRNAEAGWVHNHLRRVLLAPTLGGSWTYKAETGPIDVVIPAILSPERHAALLDALNATSTTAGERDRVYPLSGRLVGPCGGAFHGIWRRNRGSRFYRCRNSRPESPERCGCRTVVADQIESLAWREVASVLSDPTRLLALAEEYMALQASQTDGTEPGDLDAVERKLAQLDEAKTRHVVTALKAGVDADTLQRAMVEIEREREALEAHRRRLLALRRQAEIQGDRAARLRDLATTAQARLGGMSPTERRSVLGLLDVRVEIARWDRCPTCDGKGKLKGGRGGLPCPTCHATRHVPRLSLSGVVPEDVDVDDLGGEVLRHPASQVAHGGVPFRMALRAA